MDCMKLLEPNKRKCSFLSERHHKVSPLMKFHQNTHNYTEYDVNESVRNSYQTRSTLKHLGSFLEGREGGGVGRGYHPRKVKKCEA